MTLPTFTLRQLLEAGIHFGHTCRRWNPKMDMYIFGEKNKIHIIDLQKTAPLLKVSLQAVHDVAATGGKILFVCTKRQGSQLVKEAAERCGQYFVNHRWLGGMLTNWKTVSNSIGRLKSLEAQLADEESALTKKEKLKLEREIEKLTNVLGGILDMNGTPDMVVVLDVNRDHIAVTECNKLNIPLVGILDTNSNPDGITFPVPGNDDAIRSLELYCKLFADSVIAGQQAGRGAKGMDLGASEMVVEEVVEIVESEEKPVAAEKADVVAEKKETAAKKPAAKAKAEKEEKPAAKEEAAPKAKAEKPVAEKKATKTAAKAEKPAAEKKAATKAEKPAAEKKAEKKPAAAKKTAEKAPAKAAKKEASKE